MQVNPSNVTASDIRRYEQLMSGKAIRAASNAFTASLGKEDYLSERSLRTKHHWNVEDGETVPLELEFERPTSLIALNIELTFNCKVSTQEFAERATTTTPSLSRNVSKQAEE